MFDLRTEAEMRLYSDRVARELASKRRHDEGAEEPAVAEANPVTEPERAA